MGEQMRESGIGQSAESAPAAADRRRWWQVDCRDLSNAHRNLAVLVDRDEVELVGPPGHAAVLSALGVRQLSTALRDAAMQARK
ncbi:hypothetical protein SAMN05421805_103276 [Saccharopolyspora antimicrobica]|uniref:Uncharacterized protein n=1 Tax=Saccharopolyspora antimicrobica TaxID=455193 RepID=A0A1I4X848_9PSEU|nr:hypothetical protein [Saccharopolyspora antimicrobica]RKT84349.1 hypothetical protein ATL45_2660 [Saccharopolyspora antimicrobica]SFN21550.1 hypothetical protein SAMN05421805_103276 [Saccharopolyspora antimicrobica]